MMKMKLVYCVFFISIVNITSFFTFASPASPDEPYLGFNIGTELSNFPYPEALVSFLQLQKISHVRLYDADPGVLKALAHSKIRVIVGIPNDQLLAIGTSNVTAVAWVKNNVLAYYPETVITGISVGDEVLTTVPVWGPVLVPAMQFLYGALAAQNLSSIIKVSTPHAASLILDMFPPSQAFFNQSLNSVILPLLGFLSRTGSPLMVNLYPYYVFMENRGVVSLEASLLRPLSSPSKEMVDPNTLLHYTNVLDAMIDAAYFAMKNVNFTDIKVMVMETGWPSRGDSNEPYATVVDAVQYNSNLIKHVFGRTGTPLHPEVTSSVYLYELFNEDTRMTPLSEANWGFFYGNFTPVYLLHISGTDGFLASDTANQTYCVAMEGVDDKTLQTALDWACGPGLANCTGIQPGESCFQPNDIRSHASFAFDSYYQKEGKRDVSCNFQGVAMITTTDPSYGGCIFPGSLKEKNAMQPTANSTATSGTDDRTSRIASHLSQLLLLIMVIGL
ncbi:hypothetical protein MLD38_019408 [Melastoma candidum]|uniref:Uncharacterized protein n=1 Tax=Melastoma candidum TaxID=119954 RepID=A0ACB9QWC1_9MYRT|nr:hypothetical protein MLD38_019408 [Melastoma candidum]